MAEVAHSKFQRQINEFAQLTQDDQLDLLADLCLEVCRGDNVDLSYPFSKVAAKLDHPLAEVINDWDAYNLPEPGKH